MAMTTKQFKDAIRNGAYAWPGGYQMFFLCADGEALSFAAAKQEAKQIIREIRDNSNCGWRVVAFDINWEDSDLRCAHTGERIPSSYGDADEYDR